MCTLAVAIFHAIEVIGKTNTMYLFCSQHTLYYHSLTLPRHIPMTAAGLPCTASDLPPSMTSFSPPQPRQSSVLLSQFQAELFGLALSNKALQGPWLRLYTNEEDGLSFNRYVPCCCWVCACACA